MWLRNRIVNIILVFMFLISLCRYYSSKNVDLSKDSLAITLLMVVFALLVFSLRKEKCNILNNNCLKPSFIFFVGFIIVHFFEYLAFVLGVHEYIWRIEFVNPSVVSEASICSLCSLLMLLIGYNIANYKSRYRNNIKEVRFCIGKILDIILSASVILFYIFTDKYYFKGGYSDILNGEGLSLISEISQKIIHACQLAYCFDKVSNINNHISVRKYVFSYSLVYYLSMLFYFVLVLASGDRGPILYIGLIYVASYYIINRIKMKLSTCIVCLVIAACTISLFGTVRELSGNLSAEKILRAQQYRESNLMNENFLFSNTSELSNVVSAYHVLYYYTNEVGSIHALGLVNQMLGIVPGLRYFLYPLLDINTDYLDSAMLSTQLLNSDHGMGSTCLADLYLNLGFIGSIVLSMLFGMLLRKLDLLLYEIGHSSNIYMSLLCLSVLSFSIYISRSTYFIPLGLSFYAWLIIWGSLKLKKLMNR